MRKTQTQIGLFLIAMLMLIIGCQPDQIESTPEGEVTTDSPIIQDDPYAEFKQQFDLNEIDDTQNLINDKISVVWDKATEMEFEGKTWIEFPIVQHIRPTLKFNFITNVEYSLLATMTNQGPLLYINKMSSYNNSPYYSLFSLEEKFYTGMVHLYQISGKPVVMRYYGKGNLVSSLLHEDFDLSVELPVTARCTQRSSLTAACESTNNCDPPATPNNPCGGNATGSYVLVYTSHTTDWYYDRNGDGRAQSSEYANTQFNGYTSEWVWVPGSGGSGPLYDSAFNYYMYNDYSGGYQINYNPSPRLRNKLTFEFAIQDDPCLKGVMKGLLKKGNDLKLVADVSDLEQLGHVTEYILNLFEGSQEYDLTIDVKQLGTRNGFEISGETTKVGNNITVWLDRDLVRRGTKLAMAKTTIHEVMHAFILYGLNKHRNSDLASDLTSLYNHYNTTYDERTSNNLAHHQFISQYVEAIARSLAIWDDNRLPFDYYEKLSWGGLETSTAYQAKSGPEKTAIQKVVLDEKKNRSGAQGDPCN